MNKFYTTKIQPAQPLQDYLLAQLPTVRDECIETHYSLWTIDDWASMTDKLIRGPVFRSGNQQWCVNLYPTGNHLSENISIYLENVDCATNKEAAEDVCAQFMLCMIHPTDPLKHQFKIGHHRFTQYEPNWGFRDFMKLDDFYGRTEEDQQDQESFLCNGSAQIVAVVRLFKDATGVLWHRFINYNSKEVTGHVGLKNQGATCYMNSLFQSLFFTNLYRKAVYQIPTAANEDARNNTVLALQRLFYNLQFSDEAVSTVELTQSFGWTSAASFMQHDVQEFNRILQDTMEKKMAGTPADGLIKKMFVGTIKSYIKCIEVEYESSRKEDYYDIQLNVKGCNDLKASFEDYVKEETLEGDNSYMAGKFGLQSAKKGVIFEAFPPVLHLQLKRFEYDMHKDTMTKINDRHEYPLELDLEPYLSPDADRSHPYKYILHGVLVHTGNLLGGHYFAYIKPTKQEKWFKFNDDRVTPASLPEVLEDNYGGSSSEHGDNGIATNAYMLVYIRQSEEDYILNEITKDDIPLHLAEQIKEEQETQAMVEKQRAEQHLYIKVYVVRDADFLANQGTDLISSDANVEEMQMLRDMTLGDFKLHYASENNVAPETLRIWNITERRDGPLRPSKLFEDQEYNQNLQDIRNLDSYFPFIRLYIESCDSHDNKMAPPEYRLVFVKLFDPDSQSLRGIGKAYLKPHDSFVNVESTLSKLAGFKRNTVLDIYKEVNPSNLSLLNRNMRIIRQEIQNGDILCVQRYQGYRDAQLLRDQGKLFNAAKYFHFLRNRVDVVFTNKQDRTLQLVLTLRKDMRYHEVVQYIAQSISCQADHIQIILPDAQQEPGRPVKPFENLTLLDIFQLTPFQEYTFENSLDFQWILYYCVLPISLSEFQYKDYIQLQVCYTTLSMPQTVERILPRFSTIQDLRDSLKVGDKELRVYRVVDHQVSHVFGMEDGELIPVSQQDGMYAEIIPDEEYHINDQDFYISVYHYDRELTQKHSIPFRFLVIKDETFDQTKKRLKARIGLYNEDWNKVKFNLISMFITPLKDDDFKLSSHFFKKGDALGLDHPDPLGTAEPMAIDRGTLHIRD